MKHLESGVVWGILLLLGGLLLVLDALGVQIVSDAFWGILLLLAGALVLLRAVEAAAELLFGRSLSVWPASLDNQKFTL